MNKHYEFLHAEDKHPTGAQCCSTGRWRVGDPKDVGRVRITGALLGVPARASVDEKTIAEFAEFDGACCPPSFRLPRGMQRFFGSGSARLAAESGQTLLFWRGSRAVAPAFRGVAGGGGRGARCLAAGGVW